MELQNIVNCLNNLADGNDIDNSRIYIYNEAHAANTRIAELEAALLSIRYYVNNPSAWSNYDEMVSETMRDALKAARLLDGDK